MAASSKKQSAKQVREQLNTHSIDNGELARFVKIAVADAIKEVIITLVEQVVTQLSTKTQATVAEQL